MVSIDDLQKSYMGFSNRGAPDPDPDPDLAGYPVNFVDPVQIRIRPDPECPYPAVRSGSGLIQNLRIRILLKHHKH